LTVSFHDSVMCRDLICKQQTILQKKKNKEKKIKRIMNRRIYDTVWKVYQVPVEET